MLGHPDILSPSLISDDSTVEEDEEEVDFGAMNEVGVYGVILESHSDPRYHVSKKSNMVIPQRLSSTTALRSKRIISNFARKINDHRLFRVN